VPNSRIYSEVESQYEIPRCIFGIAEETKTIVEVDISSIKMFAKHTYN
jgi:hypothetical protein